MQAYLQSSRWIDHHHPAIKKQCQKLSNGLTDELDIARSCFEFVRDNIQHSGDYKRDEVTCSASDVLFHKTGWCYAKSHLLAALLRANGIPTALCYQRLTFDGDTGPYCLHGLNAVYFNSHGWYRLDARGNKAGVNAQFRPPLEQLAFPITHQGEFNIEGLWIDPLPDVVQLLTECKSYIDVINNLPDVTSWKNY